MSVERRRQPDRPRHPRLPVYAPVRAGVDQPVRFYYQSPCGIETLLNLALMRLIDEQFLATPIGKRSRQMNRRSHTAST